MSERSSLRPGEAIDGDRPSGASPRPGEIRREDFHRIRPKLVTKIRRFGIPEAEVEDLVQETFFAAHNGLRDQRFENRSALDTWVVSIAKNLCLKHHRARSAAKRSAVEVSIESPRPDDEAPLELVADVPTPDRHAEDRELLRRVKELIGELPDILRNPLVLKARGHSYRQIAQVLAISPNLVSSRLHQARAELQRKLAGPSAH